MGNCTNNNKRRMRIFSDDIYNISLPYDDIVFTRYLYIKDEVKLALRCSILLKSDDAIFWAYELYWSGFVKELVDTLWSIYYDHFATLNPSYEQYFLKKQKEFIVDYMENEFQCDNRFVSAIVQDFLIRPFNTDVFMMRIICDVFEIGDEDTSTPKWSQWFQDKNYRSIGYYLLNGHFKGSYLELYKNLLTEFEQQGFTIKDKKKQETLFVKVSCNERAVKLEIILFAKIMSIFATNQGLNKGRNFYIIVDPSEVVQYETIESSGLLKPYNVLKVAAAHNINGLRLLHLFKLNRHKYSEKDLKTMYREKWLYHASFSPIWRIRLHEGKGWPIYANLTVGFSNTDCEEMFYSKYGLEPDEQPQYVQDKSIGAIALTDADYNWVHFEAQFGEKSLIRISLDELEELNAEPIHL